VESFAGCGPRARVITDWAISYAAALPPPTAEGATVNGFIQGVILGIALAREDAAWALKAAEELAAALVSEMEQADHLPTHVRENLLYIRQALVLIGRAGRLAQGETEHQ
jgi:hypothetical protein